MRNDGGNSDEKWADEKKTNDLRDKHAHFTHMSPRHSGEESVKIIIFIIFYFWQPLCDFDGICHKFSCGRINLTNPDNPAPSLGDKDFQYFHIFWPQPDPITIYQAHFMVG